MPSSIAYAAASVLVVPLVAPANRSRALVDADAVLAAVPDLDTIGGPFSRGDVLWLVGHRAVAHSLLAPIVGAVVVAFISMSDGSRSRVARLLAARAKEFRDCQRHAFAFT